jgi:hypothetical protein
MRLRQKEEEKRERDEVHPTPCYNITMSLMCSSPTHNWKSETTGRMERKQENRKEVSLCCANAILLKTGTLKPFNSFSNLSRRFSSAWQKIRRRLSERIV